MCAQHSARIVMVLLALLFVLVPALGLAAAGPPAQEEVNCRTGSLPGGLTWGEYGNYARDTQVGKVNYGPTRSPPARNPAGVIVGFTCDYSALLGARTFGYLAAIVDNDCEAAEKWKSLTPRLQTDLGTPIPITGRTETAISGRLGPIRSEVYSGWLQVSEEAVFFVRPYAFVRMRLDTHYDAQTVRSPRILSALSFQGLATALATTYSLPPG